MGGTTLFERMSALARGDGPTFEELAARPGQEASTGPGNAGRESEMSDGESIRLIRSALSRVVGSVEKFEGRNLLGRKRFYWRVRAANFESVAIGGEAYNSAEARDEGLRVAAEVLAQWSANDFAEYVTGKQP